MGKKTSWIIIIATIAINVVMLQWTIEAYLGREFERIIIFNVISVICAALALIAYFKWRKIEYKK